MATRYDFSIELHGKTEDEILRTLQAEVASRTKDANPLKTWRWWSGFIWGAIIIAAMDFGDVHFCVGQCDGKGGFQEIGLP